MRQPFYKMQGLGNDFIVFENFLPSVEQAITFANRHVGIGADQILCLSAVDSAMPRVVFLNADGSVATLCGNGLRCLGLLLWRLTRHSQHTVQVELPQRALDRTLMMEKAGRYTLEYLGGDTVCVDMGSVSFLSRPEREDLLRGEELAELAHLVTGFGVADVGNQHLVLFLKSPSPIAPEKIALWGSFLETHSLFPQRINVGFVSQISSSTLSLTVWERGAGLTRACGSGAVAAAALGKEYFALSSHMSVIQRGGTLKVDVSDLQNCTQTGSACLAFEGTVDI